VLGGENMRFDRNDNAGYAVALVGGNGLSQSAKDAHDAARRVFSEVFDPDEVDAALRDRSYFSVLVHCRKSVVDNEVERADLVESLRAIVDAARADSISAQAAAVEAIDARVDYIPVEYKDGVFVNASGGRAGRSSSRSIKWKLKPDVAPVSRVGHIQISIGSA
jgi:hypothetical protein